MTGRNTLKYPDADPGSDLYQQLFRNSLYPEEETLPKTKNGKIDRKLLLERAIEEGRKKNG